MSGLTPVTVEAPKMNANPDRYPSSYAVEQESPCDLKLLVLDHTEVP